MNYQWIGWLSSLVLVLTIARQIQKEWLTKSVRDISSWLFVGQLFAEIGFVIYSLILRNWVFVAVNSVLVLENLIGLLVTLTIRKNMANAQPSHGRA